MLMFYSLRNKTIKTASSFPQMKKMIERAKNSTIQRSTVKSRYSTLKELGEYLQQNPQCLRFVDTANDISLSISAELLQSSTDSYHVLFYDEKLISQYNQENAIFVDSSFHIVPDVQDAKQLFTIMCKKHDTVKNISSFQFIIQKFLSMI